MSRSSRPPFDQRARARAKGVRRQLFPPPPSRRPPTTPSFFRLFFLPRHLLPALTSFKPHANVVPLTQRPVSRSTTTSDSAPEPAPLPFPSEPLAVEVERRRCRAAAHDDPPGLAALPIRSSAQPSTRGTASGRVWLALAPAVTLVDDRLQQPRPWSLGLGCPDCQLRLVASLRPTVGSVYLPLSLIRRRTTSQQLPSASQLGAHRPSSAAPDVRPASTALPAAGSMAYWSRPCARPYTPTAASARAEVASRCLHRRPAVPEDRHASAPAALGLGRLGNARDARSTSSRRLDIHRPSHVHRALSFPPRPLRDRLHDRGRCGG